MAVKNAPVCNCILVSFSLGEPSALKVDCEINSCRSVSMLVNGPGVKGSAFTAWLNAIFAILNASFTVIAPSSRFATVFSEMLVMFKINVVFSKTSSKAFNFFKSLSKSLSTGQ